MLAWDLCMVNNYLTLRAEPEVKGGYCNPRLTHIVCYSVGPRYQ